MGMASGPSGNDLKMNNLKEGLKNPAPILQQATTTVILKVVVDHAGKLGDETHWDVDSCKEKFNISLSLT